MKIDSNLSTIKTEGGVSRTFQGPICATPNEICKTDGSGARLRLITSEEMPVGAEVEYFEADITLADGTVVDTVAIFVRRVN